jgi:phospholipid/cholesterol/gamma-HCH transport system ATP-binding protein
MMKKRRELRTEIGMVFQGSALFDSMTVAENVAFPLKCLLETMGQKNQEQCRLCAKSALTDAHNKLPSEISGGMQKGCDCKSYCKQT